MIYFDVTKSVAAKHQSGLVRVSQRLRAEMGAQVTEIRWTGGRWAGSRNERVSFTTSDWILTPELFSQAERPGFWEFLKSRVCRTAAIFHDAIPLKHPHITWPKSVARQPEYMKMLALFDQVFAVSRTSAEELTGFWSWQGVQGSGPVKPIALGADARLGLPRVQGADTPSAAPSFVCVGIVEPRKNQLFLADVAEGLVKKGSPAHFHFIGRVNPLFGRAIASRLKTLARQYSTIHYHENLPDERLLPLWRNARATLFPTLAEGYGLPLLESLWQGVPCLCNDLPVLRENADGGGCVLAGVAQPGEWVEQIERLTRDDAFVSELRVQATRRSLTTWRETSSALLRALDAPATTSF